MAYRTTKRKLLCQLTEAEKASFGSELAGLRQRYSDREEEAAAVAKRHRQELEASWDRMGVIAAILESGQEEREVDCHVIPDHSALTVIYKRTDTGETVFERPMDDDERQGRLSFEAEEEESPAGPETMQIAHPDGATTSVTLSLEPDTEAGEDAHV